MAKQKGVIKVSGTLDDLTFGKTRFGFSAGMRTSLTKERILKDAGFIRTRENMSEFAKAAAGGKVLRNAFHMQLQGAKDGRIVPRLVKEMMKVVHSDAVNERGKRDVTHGEIDFLNNFNTNIDALLQTTLYVSHAVSIDRPTGLAEVTLVPFIPSTGIIAPAGATHFKIISAASDVNFDEEKFTTVASDSGLLPLNSIQVPQTTLSNQLPAASTNPLFMVLGMQFFQVVNGTPYPLNTGSFNPLSIVAVSAQ